MYESLNMEREDIRKETEVNIYEALHMKWVTTTSSAEKQKCIDLFRTYYPNSQFDISKNCIENGIMDTRMIEDLLKSKYQILSGICEQIIQRE